MMVMHNTRPTTHPITIPATLEDEPFLPIPASFEASCDSKGLVGVTTVVVVIVVNDAVTVIGDATISDSIGVRGLVVVMVTDAVMDVMISDIKELVLVIVRELVVVATAAEDKTDVATGVTDIDVVVTDLIISTQINTMDTYQYMLAYNFENNRSPYQLEVAIGSS